MKIKEFKDVDIKFEKEVYLKNRAFILEEFAGYLEALKTVENENRDFVLMAIFREIRDQKKFISLKLPHVNVKEEKEILKQMIKDTKSILKKEYNFLFEQFK